MLIRAENIHSWVIKKLEKEGRLNEETLKSIDEEDAEHGVLLLDYLVSMNVLSLRISGNKREYQVEDKPKLSTFLKPKPSTSKSTSSAPVKLVYSAPPSLLSDVQSAITSHPDSQILSLEQAFREISDEAEETLSIVSPFIEWDGLGYFSSTIKSAAERGIKLRMLTRGALFPERASEYPYLSKVKTLLEIISLYRQNATNPEAKIEIRDFTVRIQSPASNSIHFEGIHQKMFIADREIAYVGSGEIRGASFLSNGECGVILRGEPAAFWADFFELFWKNGQLVSKSQLEDCLSSTRNNISY